MLSKVGDLCVTGNVGGAYLRLFISVFTQLSQPESSPEPVTSPSDEVRPAVCGSSVPRCFKNISQGRGGTAGRRRHPRANEGSPGLPKVAAAARSPVPAVPPAAVGPPRTPPRDSFGGVRGHRPPRPQFPLLYGGRTGPLSPAPSSLTTGLPARGSSAAHPAQAVPAVSGP